HEGGLTGLWRLPGAHEPGFVGPLMAEASACVWPTAALSAIEAPDRSEIVKDSHPKSDYRRDAEIDTQLVTEERQAGGQGHVRDQAAEEDARLERAGDVGLESAEDRVERRQQRDGGVARVRDRDGDRRQDPEQRAEEREQDRDDDYLHAGAGVGAGVGFAPGDGLGGAGSFDLNAAAGSDAFITLM